MGEPMTVDLDLNEANTRAEYIETALQEARWGTRLTPYSRIDREHAISLGKLIGAGQRSKGLSADFVLLYKGKKLAVIEAKRVRLHPTEGVQQAKDYAELLNIRFAYSTNGKGIYCIDMHTAREYAVDRYPTPDELWQATFETPSTWRERFAAIPFEDKSGSWQPRYYQHNAIEKTLEALIAGKDRILLNLATGTGKTAIAFQIAWKLFQSRWNVKTWRNNDGTDREPRILFLADRNILADQAYNSFSAFPEDALVRIDPKTINKRKGVPKNGNLFFTIFQTFMAGAKDADGKPTASFWGYPPDFFDLIIIDECHRGGANDESSWRTIMEYFSSAVQLGLTATPRREENADTYNYFGEPVYTYALKDGINDGFLTPFRIKRIASTIDEYQYQAGDEVEGELDTEKTYTEADINRIVEIEGREKHRVKTFMEMIDPHEKTLVFCATQDHALAVRNLINQMKISKQPKYCERVAANDGAKGEAVLKQFQDNEKTIPTILTTSRKLSTGVDARNVRNIILLRPVTDMVEFKQILGRGTRLYDQKDYFTLYDFVKAYDLFSDPAWDGEPIPDICKKCNNYPCTCEKQQRICKTCGQRPCVCLPEHCSICGCTPCECLNAAKAKVTLGAHRQLVNIIATEFLGEDGKPISAAQYLEQFLGTLPEFFKDEDELRRIWGNPTTRKQLLDGFAAKGYSAEQLNRITKVVNAERSDFYDVLAHLNYSLPLQTREERVAIHKPAIFTLYNDQQREFLEFVLDHYINQGVNELDPTKLGDLIKLKYRSIPDAVNVLGDVKTIRKLFIEFQQGLYD
jgi:type I restriction enzyme R subunit